MIRILSLTLALLIAVTSQQMAMARGMMKDASGQVVLCTGSGPVTITLDAQGDPLNGTGGPVHICPDCALTMMAFVDAAPVASSPVIHIQTLTQTPVATLQIHVIPAVTHARGPPLTV